MLALRVCDLDFEQKLIRVRQSLDSATRKVQACETRDTRGGFHAARHGATSEMLAQGAAPTVVQKQMRHSDARITLGIYGYVVGNAEREEVEKHAERIEK